MGMSVCNNKLIIRSDRIYIVGNLGVFRDRERGKGFFVLYCFSKVSECKGQQEVVIFEVNQLRQMIDLNMSQEQVNNKYFMLCQLRDNIANEIKIAVDEMNLALKDILDNELQAWKKEQQLAENGFEATKSLAPIRQWCESLTRMILHTMTHIEDIQTLKQKLSDNDHCSWPIESLLQLKTEITHVLTRLISGTFIVEKQPPQVLKKDVTFDTRICLLVGGQVRGLTALPKVTVSLISEAQAGKITDNTLTF